MSTIKDIAKKTGLGLATISKYINGGNVLPENQSAIEIAIKELDYKINSYARGLKTKKSKTIGIIIPQFNSLFFTALVSAIEDRLRKENYAVILCDCSNNRALEKETVEFLIEKMVDGIICMPVDNTGESLLPALKRKIPVVLVDQRIDSIDCDSIIIDNIQAAKSATQFLINKGHKKIAIIHGPLDIFTAAHRFEGYCQALKENNIIFNERIIINGKNTIEGSIIAIETLLKNTNEMTAIFTTNYDMTLGAVMYLKEKRIRLPDELFLLGFDNIELAKATSPQLTVVVQPINELGTQAAELMLKRIEGNKAMPQTIMLSANIFSPIQ